MLWWAHLNLELRSYNMLQKNWNGSSEDWLHGDEHLDDEDSYAPMEQWEIDEAVADIKGDQQWLEEREI